MKREKRERNMIILLLFKKISFSFSHKIPKKGTYKILYKNFIKTQTKPNKIIDEMISLFHFII